MQAAGSAVQGLLASSKYNKIDVGFIHKEKEASDEYHVWPLDDAQIAERLRTRYAPSITTDVPGVTRRHLTPQLAP